MRSKYKLSNSFWDRRWFLKAGWVSTVFVLSFFSGSAGGSADGSASSGSLGFGMWPVGGFDLAAPSFEIYPFDLSCSMIAKVLYFSAYSVFSSIFAEI